MLNQQAVTFVQHHVLIIIVENIDIALQVEMNVQMIIHIFKQQVIHQNVDHRVYSMYLIIKRFVHHHVVDIINIQFLQQHLINV